MPMIRITKEQVKQAQLARKKALSEDAEYRKFTEEQERELKEALEQTKKEMKEDTQ